jgi:hypothetical protein
MPSGKYIAFAVELGGAATARYELAASDEVDAIEEARQHLRNHPVIEVWDGGFRRIARLKRDH